MSRTFNTYGAISNALKHLQLDLQKEKKKMGQGKYSKRLNPRAGGEGGAAYLGTL